MNTILIKHANFDTPRGIQYARRNEGVLPYDLVATIFEDKTLIFEANRELSEMEVENLLNISKNFETIYNSLRE